MTYLEQALVPPVYETLEPDICNITLNHDVGFCIFFDIHWKLGYDFQRKCGKCGKLDVQSCSNVRWLPVILLYPRFAAKSLNCFSLLSNVSH